ncbi:MAG: Ig-like domain-containing protein [Candidatus Sulfotelmatobacter sp.]
MWPTTPSIAFGATQQFSAIATYSDGSTGIITTTASWSAATSAVATINSAGLATAVAPGLATLTASLSGVNGSTTLNITIPPGTGANVPLWHFDAQRSGLNAGETWLTTTNVDPQNFGKLFTYLLDGYVYGQPLLVSNVTINGGTHNVVYAATENDSVYAFDADNYGTGAPLWQVSLLQTGETPITDGPIQPVEGVTSTPAIDLTTNTIFVVSTQTSASSSTFRLNALDITTGEQKTGSPVTIQATVAGTNATTLTTACLQRAALLVTNGSVFIGFGSCLSGWLLAYDEQTLAQTGVFNASPNLVGEGPYASAGGIWMSGAGPAADDLGNIYVTTGNGPWDGQTAWSDSVLKFNAQLTIEDYFTPDDYEYEDCADADMAAGGLLLIPGTTDALVGGKTGKLYLVNTTNLGHESANDAGATQTFWFENDLTAPYSASCTDANGNTWTTDINSYEIFGTAAYFNQSVYLGVTPTTTTAAAGVREFPYSGTLTQGNYTTPSILENSRGTTPFISANGTANGILWMIDQGQPLQSPTTITAATLRAYNADDLTTELYNSGANAGDVPGYGIKFTSPIVANGKVYITTGHDPVTATNPQGELDVYGLK